MSTSSQTGRPSGTEDRLFPREEFEAVYLPNPDEIERRAAEIRAGWSAREYRRRGTDRQPVRLSPVRFAPADAWRWNDT
jgi:hypothetical protein